MANKQVGGLDGLGFVNKKRTGSSVSSNDDLVTTPANYASIADLRAALTAANGAYYTSAMLDKMNTNDMVYAVRMLVDGGTSSTGTI
jgi:hypothetical protein